MQQQGSIRAHHLRELLRESVSSAITQNPEGTAAYLGIDVGWETAWHTECSDEGLDTFGRHRVFGVESGDTPFHEQGGKEGRGTMTGLTVSLGKLQRHTARGTYTSEEDELGTIFLVLESRDQSVSVCVGKVETWTGSLHPVRLDFQ